MDSQARHTRARTRLGAAFRSRRHPIRSTILVAIAAGMATIALVLAASSNSALAASPLVNGNFERGDLTGSSVDTADGGDANVVDRYVYWENLACEYDCRVFVSPREGSSFALVSSADEVASDPKISQPFEASNGDKVSGWAFFHTYHNWYSLFTGTGDDKAQVVITNDSGTTVGTPFEERVSSVAQGGYSGWKYWEHTFTGLTGTRQFRIEARLQIPGPSGTSICPEVGSEFACSVIGLDDVKTSVADPDATKPSTSATRSVEPNAAGWNNENLTVRLKATDNVGGWGVQKITYSASGAQTIAQTEVSGSSVEIPLNQEGTTTLTYYATDKAGNVEDQKSLTVKIDKTAPTVQSISPSAGATRVPRDTNVTAKFSEDVIGVLAFNTFMLSNGTSFSSLRQIQATVSYVPSSKTATLDPYYKPSSRLARCQWYTAIVTSDIKDIAGNPIGERMWTFRTSGC
jgi:Bacterial Ig-like domain